jgi:hypothetical protein
MVLVQLQQPPTDRGTVADTAGRHAHSDWRNRRGGAMGRLTRQRQAQMTARQQKQQDAASEQMLVSCTRVLVNRGAFYRAPCDRRQAAPDRGPRGGRTG